MWLLFLYLITGIVMAIADVKSLKVSISDASKAAYRKYIEETCQSEKAQTVEDYLNWEEHQFVKSLRIQLMPETVHGDLSTYAKSDLVNFLPVTVVAGDKKCKILKGIELEERLKRERQLRDKDTFYDEIFSGLLSHTYFDVWPDA